MTNGDFYTAIGDPLTKGDYVTALVHLIILVIIGIVVTTGIYYIQLITKKNKKTKPDRKD